MAPALSKAFIISTCLQGLLQGVAISVFALMTFILTRESRRRPANRCMLAASSALIVLSTVEFAWSIVRLVRGLVTVGPYLPGGAEKFLTSPSEPIVLIKGILQSIQILILDGMVIFRAYVAWQNYFVIVIPAIGWCGILISTIGKVYFLIRASKYPENSLAFQSGPWAVAVFATTLSTNITATFLLAYRLWKVNRCVEGVGLSPKLRVVYQAVIETGAIYTTLSTTTLFLFIVHDPMAYSIRDFVSPIISIVFNMIVVRVGFARSRKLSVLGIEGSGAVMESAIVGFGDNIFHIMTPSPAEEAAIPTNTSPTRSDAKQGMSVADLDSANLLSGGQEREGTVIPLRDGGDAHAHLI